ncbi:MAG: hypothetical protein BWX72_01735 [Firmicutes bacterium ADurb.Bin080]|nr:MAG: hypothetical protein BWX72_01735 [Firmicutes bacterium ADurb.Bin080]
MRKRKELYKEFKLEYYEENGKRKSRVVYTGDYFLLNLDIAQAKRTRIEFIIYAIVVNAFLFGSLFIDTLSGYKMYIVIPQILSFAMSLIFLYFFSPFLLGLRKFNSKQKEDVFVAPKGYLISKVALIFFTVIARIVMISVEINTYDLTTEIVLLGLLALCLLASVRELSIFTKLKLSKEEKTADSTEEDFYHQ